MACKNHYSDYAYLINIALFLNIVSLTCTVSHLVVVYILSFGHSEVCWGLSWRHWADFCKTAHTALIPGQVFPEWQCSHESGLLVWANKQSGCFTKTPRFIMVIELLNFFEVTWNPECCLKFSFFIFCWRRVWMNMEAWKLWKIQLCFLCLKSTHCNKYLLVTIILLII